MKKKYAARFFGCLRGAIGIHHTMVEAEDEEKARLALYDRFDHVQSLALQEIKPPARCPVCGASPRTHACDEEACEPTAGEE